MNREYRTFNSLLQEELDKFVEIFINKKNKAKNKKPLNEIFTMSINNFMKDIGSQEIDDNTEIDTELWEWFVQTVDKSMQEEPDEWIKLLKEQKLKILCYKFFTKKELIAKDELEDSVRKQITKYFTALQNYTDLSGFREKISNLPSELLSNLVRYLFNYSEILEKKIIISKKELTNKIKELYNERQKMVEKVDLVSKSYQTVLDISNLKNLYNNGLFFEDNIVNRGINEYIFKLLGNKNAEKKIKDAFSNTFITDLQQQTQTSSAYINHIEAIKKEEGHEFFSLNGYQIGSRFSNEIEAAKDKNNENYIVDKNSVFKEPNNYLSSTVSPWEKDSNYGPGNMDDEELDGGSSGGGGGSDIGGFGGSNSMSGDTFDSPVDLDTDTGEELPAEESGEDGDTPLPQGEDGFPVDFGSEETNPEATENSEDNKDKK